MSKVIIFTHDRVPLNSKEIASGPGLRFWSIGKALKAAGHQVTVAVPSYLYNDSISSNELDVVIWTNNNLGVITRGFDCAIVVMGWGDLSLNYSRLVNPNLPTVVDVYDPIFIEANINFPPDSQGMLEFENILAANIPLYKRGDLFLCANRRQYDYYVGLLNGLGRINPVSYEYPLIRYTPFGVDESLPVHKKRVIKGVMCKKSDMVILWVGGIYPWFDGITVVRAMKEVILRFPNAKLVFLGGKHPAKFIKTDNYQLTVKEATTLDLINKNVFFIDRWVPFNQMGNYYSEADIAISMHINSLETKYCHRTRIVHYLWGRIPVVCTEGDEMSDLVSKYECGRTVGEKDVTAVANALSELLGDKGLRKKMSMNCNDLVLNELLWSKTIAQLDSFCQNPRLAPDRLMPLRREIIDKNIRSWMENNNAATAGNEHRMIMEKIVMTCRASGIFGVVKKILGKLG